MLLIGKIQEYFFYRQLPNSHDSNIQEPNILRPENWVIKTWHTDIHMDNKPVQWNKPVGICHGLLSQQILLNSCKSLLYDRNIASPVVSCLVELLIFAKLLVGIRQARNSFLATSY